MFVYLIHNQTVMCFEMSGLLGLVVFVIEIKEIIFQQVETYEEAVRTVQPKFQTGKLSSIWISFAKFYEREKQLNDVSRLFVHKSFIAKNQWE